MILCDPCNNAKGDIHPLDWYNGLPQHQKSQELLEKVKAAIALEICPDLPQVKISVKIRGLERFINK